MSSESERMKVLRKEYALLVNRLHHLSMIFAGDVLAGAYGLVVAGDPRLKSVRDVADLAYILRAELNAMTAILIKKGIMTVEEWTEQLCNEFEYLIEKKEKQFRIKLTDEGIKKEF